MYNGRDDPALTEIMPGSARGCFSPGYSLATARVSWASRSDFPPVSFTTPKTSFHLRTDDLFAALCALCSTLAMYAAPTTRGQVCRWPRNEAGCSKTSLLSPRHPGAISQAEHHKVMTRGGFTAA